VEWIATGTTSIVELPYPLFPSARPIEPTLVPRMDSPTISSGKDRRTDSRKNQPLTLDFSHNSNYYYLMSRFAWVFYLIALLFAALALVTGLLALCSRLGGYLSSMITMVALFFQAMAAALVTVWAVKGRDAFKKDGFSASIGVKAIAFTWTSFACFFLATILFCISGSIGKQSESTGLFVKRSRSTRSTRSRGSFVSDRRVKDDYS
jgi:hypothetical protein